MGGAVKEVFPKSKSCQEKGCPRGAYLGLCEEGLVRDVPLGDHTRSKKNKAYAISAATILRKQPHIAQDTDALWNMALGGLRKVPKGQMEVVLALW